MEIRFAPQGVVGQAAMGETILAAADRAGVAIERVCGGRGSCGKCRVLVSGALSEPTASEMRHLSPQELAQGYRLACQARALSDLDVTVPDASRVAGVSILTGGIANHYPIEPWVTRHTLAVPPASLEDPVSDLDAVQRIWAREGRGGLRPTLRAMRALPAALRDRGGEITLVQVDGELVDIIPGPPTGCLLGIAFDVGTTTVVGYLLDLESGQELAVASELNPQTRFGDDVVSRIQYAGERPQGLDELQREIVGALGRIIRETTAQAEARPADVLAVTIAGNTTMQHLLLGVSPAHLAQAPYVPAITQAVSLRAGELGLDAHPDAHVWVMPSIAGWVGGDTVGVLLATGICEQDELALAIDIGTNGEMALGSRQRLITCSTAAGPAFEGAHISCGMRAADGAIDAVQIDHAVRWSAIGGSAPRGICGSGLVDAIAELLRVGVIDPRGKLLEPAAVSAAGYSALAEQIRGEGRHRAFVIAPGVQLGQRDIRELQLAKGAIRSGIEILMKELGVGAADVRKVYLAGAFGNYIRPESAVAIGLMPRFRNAELTPVGNAAGSGAKMALLSRAARARAAALPAQVEYLELSGRPDFQEQFAEAMLF
jgi:uncharacterized 2Fe-2S/4Fe-4S cluster protein (DUF4445 family)